MTFTSMLFLFMFLPLSLLIYWIVGDRAKEFILLAVSLLFYSFGSLDFFLLFVCATAITVTIGRIMASSDKRGVRKCLLVVGSVINASLLVYYKYSGFIVTNINSITGADLTFEKLALPLGISFFTFKAISYLADVYMGKARLPKNPLHDALYLSFFSQIQAGPLARYNEMEMAIKGERRTLFEDGVYRFIIGFNKKVLLADILLKITNEVFGTPFADFSTPYAWLGSICFTLYLFFDFSGYSDMAIGISQMFGYRCSENFNYPYMTESVARFWRRWHISLSSWFRDYIYIPMGGSRNKNKWRVYVNLFVVWLLTGIWHGAAWNFVAWGLGYFVMISFEKLTGLPDRLQSKALRIIYRILTLAFINFEWVLFNSKGLISGLRFIKRMIIYTPNPIATTRTLVLIQDYFVFILFALILCVPVVPWLSRKLERYPVLHKVFQIVYAVILLALFMWALSFIVAGQNNPFAYANF